MFDADRAKARKKPTKVSRRASSVKVSFMPVTRRRRAQVAQVTQTHVEREPNLRADFADHRPDNVHPWDWNQLYLDEPDLWDDIAEEAVHAVEVGELQRYERRRHA